MSFEYSKHWKSKRKYRPDITDDIIEYCIQNSKILRDKKGNNVYNAISMIPQSGRILKVVYKRKGKTLKILTTYWLS